MRIYVEERSPLRNTLQRDGETITPPEGRNNTLCRASRRITAGSVRLVTLDGKFTVETMDYTFSRPIGMSYHIRKGFIELVYLESANMVNREYGTGDFNIGRGLYIYRNQGRPGEFIVLPGVPVRGIRIQVLEEFYRDYLKDTFPVKELDSPYLSALNNRPYTSPPLRLVFEQIKLSINTGVDYELYYESKIS
jgi:hypothetical protein